jgi:hypothetical protein
MPESKTRVKSAAYPTANCGGCCWKTGGAPSNDHRDDLDPSQLASLFSLASSPRYKPLHLRSNYKNQVFLKLDLLQTNLPPLSLSLSLSTANLERRKKKNNILRDKRNALKILRDSATTPLLLLLLHPKLPLAPSCKTLLYSRRFLTRSPPT